jgi:transcription antitermination factor NusG
MKLPDAFSPDVMAELARPVMTHDPRDAQITAGVEPKWYVFEIASRDVEAHLIKRRFGVYVPECQETIIRRGRRIDRRIQLFPGYVFVFIWPSGENWNKIVNIRGVVASIGSLTDTEIDTIRYLENCERPIVLQYFDELQPLPHKRKRKRKPRQVVVSVPDEVVRTRAWSAFDDLVHDLDGEGRSEALRQMLDETRLA